MGMHARRNSILYLFYLNENALKREMKDESIKDNYGMQFFI